MKSTFVALALLTAAPPALAQSSKLEPGYDIAPWWMAQPVLPSVGHVQGEYKSNRANFSATFSGVAKTAQEATRLAADKVRPTAQSLAGYGADKVRVQVMFSQRPIYEQYRDKDGNLISNQRADRIDSYEATASVQIEIRDLALLERAYNAVIAARPNATQPIYFRLEPTNEINTDLYNRAITDARRRAEASGKALGVNLGPVKLIDPSGRACQTDVLLAGADRNHFLPPATQIDGGSESYGADAVAGVANFVAPAPPPPPPPPRPAPSAVLVNGQRSAGEALSSEDLKLPVQPPLQRLAATACVIYALAP